MPKTAPSNLGNTKRNAPNATIGKYFEKTSGNLGEFNNRNAFRAAEMPIYSKIALADEILKNKKYKTVEEAIEIQAQMLELVKQYDLEQRGIKVCEATALLSVEEKEKYRNDLLVEIHAAEQSYLNHVQAMQKITDKYLADISTHMHAASTINNLFERHTDTQFLKEIEVENYSTVIRSKELNYWSSLKALLQKLKCKVGVQS